MLGGVLSVELLDELLGLDALLEDILDELTNELLGKLIGELTRPGMK